MSDLIERKEVIEAIKKYGKDALSAGRKHIDPVDDIVELCNMLAALPDNYTAGVSDTARYTAVGNGWTVDVIAHILRGLSKEEKAK